MVGQDMLLEAIGITARLFVGGAASASKTRDQPASMTVAAMFILGKAYACREKN